MALGIGTQTINTIQIHTPLRPSLDGTCADRCQRDTGSGVPNFLILVDSGHGVPTRSPAMVIILVIEIDSEIDPIGRRSDFEFTIVPYVGPVVTEKHFDY